MGLSPISRSGRKYGTKSHFQVSKAYRAVDAHVTTRLRRWLCAKHKVASGGYARYPARYLTETLGLVRLPELRTRFLRVYA